MDRFLAVFAAAALVLVASVPAVARRLRRPRYAVALVAAAVVTAAWETVAAAGLLDAGIERFFFGLRVAGAAARFLAALDALLCVLGACGLWHHRAWARTGAIAYLGLHIVSFFLWGIEGAGSRDAVDLVLWQMFVLPFLVFCLMYLVRDGARYRPTRRQQ